MLALCYKLISGVINQFSHGIKPHEILKKKSSNEKVSILSFQMQECPKKYLPQRIIRELAN